jgi:hypothetical protein
VSSAAAFCSTVTAGGSTATNYPTRATAACGTAPARYISACACGPTCTATATATATCNPVSFPTNSGGILYGDFECGTPEPWSLVPADSSITATVAQPGLTGNRSVSVSFSNHSCVGGSCPNTGLLSPPVPIAGSTAYKLIWGTSVSGTSGTQFASINGRVVTTIGTGQYYPSVWVYNQAQWVSLSTETSANVSFVWTTLDGLLDTAVLSPVSAWCGPNPPIGLLADGEFECGLGSWSQQVPDRGAVAGASSNAAATGNRIGSLAWVASLVAPYNYSNTDLGVNTRIRSGSMPVVPGATYMIAFQTAFSAYGLGFVGLMVNDAPLYTRDPGDQGQNGPTVFSPNVVFWTAPAGVTAAVVRIEALMTFQGFTMVDGVIFVRVNDAWKGKFGQRRMTKRYGVKEKAWLGEERPTEYDHL